MIADRRYPRITHKTMWQTYYVTLCLSCRGFWKAAWHSKPARECPFCGHGAVIL